MKLTEETCKYFLTRRGALLSPPGGVTLCTNSNGFQNAARSQLLSHSFRVKPKRAELYVTFLLALAGYQNYNRSTGWISISAHRMLNSLLFIWCLTWGFLICDREYLSFLFLPPNKRKTVFIYLLWKVLIPFSINCDNKELCHSLHKTYTEMNSLSSLLGNSSLQVLLSTPIGINWDLLRNKPGFA